MASFVLLPSLIFLLAFLTFSSITILKTTQLKTLLLSSAQLKVLVGVFTTPDRYESRSFLRLVYGAQSPTGAIIDVRFIMCRMADAEHKITVGLEIMNYGDMIILDCRENMNDGKTYTYFSSLPRLFESNSTNPPYHYVVKADDDVYIRLQPLVESLQFVAREDAYYGCNATQRGVEYMIGSLYAVSWDITEWLSISHIPNFSGPQDILFATWLRDGHVGKNRYDIEDKLYDIQVAGTHFAHEFLPDTVGVHELKTRERWIQTLDYFNVTKDLKPSKFYYYP